jgi:hypothetical protein
MLQTKTKKRKLKDAGYEDGRGFYSNYTSYSWEFDTEYSVDLWNRAGLSSDKKKDIVKFVLSLNTDQLENFMEGMYRSEGTETEYEKRISQNCGEIADSIEIGIYLLGYKPSRRNVFDNHVGIAYIRPRINTHKLTICDPRIEAAWCVSTKLGTWTAKNKNSLFLTGNSIVEWKEEGDQQKAIEDVDRYYELLKDHVWNPNKFEEENREMRELEESDEFLKAGKRNLRKVIDPLMPNQELIEETLEE